MPLSIAEVDTTATASNITENGKEEERREERWKIEGGEEGDLKARKLGVFELVSRPLYTLLDGPCVIS